jgi:ribonuclease R
MHRKSYPTGLPTPDQVLDFIARTPSAVGKRDIAKAFGLHGADKIALKALLKDMADAGQTLWLYNRWHNLATRFSKEKV